MAYAKAFWSYLHTPKGSHDFRDDMRALAWILLTAALFMGVLFLLKG